MHSHYLPKLQRVECSLFAGRAEIQFLGQLTDHWSIAFALLGSVYPQSLRTAVVNVVEIATGRRQNQGRVHYHLVEGAIPLGYLDDNFDYVISSTSGCMAGGPATLTSTKGRSAYTRGS